MTARTMTISVGGKPVTACVCPGVDDGVRRVVCGELLPRAGRCRHCDRYMSEAEFTAAKAAAEAGERAA